MEIYEGALNPKGKPRYDAVIIEMVNDAVLVHVECARPANLEKLQKMAHNVLSDLPYITSQTK